jgi:hypothetical protein
MMAVASDIVLGYQREQQMDVRFATPLENIKPVPTITGKFIEKRRQDIVRYVPHELFDGPERLMARRASGNRYAVRTSESTFQYHLANPFN